VGSKARDLLGAGKTSAYVFGMSNEREVSEPDWDGGWMRAMAVRMVEATSERVELALDVGPQHLQPFGLVHGGVYCGLVETACSLGASLALQGAAVMGIENQTSFLRAVKSGTISTVATPVHIGRTSQLWQAEVRDEAGRLVASGRVRILRPEMGTRPPSA
jgi:1,4-dihydroxy-2-naphthoyl-CoA hydrolase